MNQQNLHLPPLKILVVVEFILLTTLVSFFLFGGDDLYNLFRPLAEGSVENGFYPWYASWILSPLRLVPLSIGPLRPLWPVWVLIIGTGVGWAAIKLEANPIVVLLSFPLLASIWLGQIDVIIIVGMVLALCSGNPAMRGVGLLMMAVKPQMAALPILVLLCYDKDRLKTLIVPAVVFLISLIVWGIDWPLRWLSVILQNKMDISRIPTWNHASLYPYGLVLIPTIFLVRGVRDRLTVALLVSALAFPWFGIYSYAAFLVLIAPWWSLPLSYAWLLAWPVLGNQSMRLAWVLPAGMLIFMLMPRIKTWLAQHNAPAHEPADHAA